MSWCCLKDWEVCSGKQNQVNVCWAAAFVNPLAAIGGGRTTEDTAVRKTEAFLGHSIATSLGSPPPSTPTPAPTTPSEGDGTSTAAGDLHISKLLEAERKKIVNESHARAVIVITVIGILIAMGLIMNAVLWILRLKHRRNAKRSVVEASGDSRMESRCNLAAPSPVIARNRMSSRFSNISRRCSQTSNHSEVSDIVTLNAMAAADFDSDGGEQLPKERYNGAYPTSPHHILPFPPISPISPISPLSPLVAECPMAVPYSPVQGHALPPRTSSIAPGLENGKEQVNIAEAYDDAPEDPVELGGYAIYERCKKATERARMAKQPRWVEKTV